MDSSNNLHLEGVLRKRSRWLGLWNLRQTAVVESFDGPLLVWSGGAKPGKVALDETCSVRLAGEQLVICRESQRLYFRAGPELALSRVQAAITSARGCVPAATPTARERAQAPHHPGADGNDDGGGGEGSGAGGEGGGAQLAMFEGERNLAGEWEGHGEARYADGSGFEGEWVAGKREGWGTGCSADGDVYEGEWRAGQREGRGSERYADGSRYEGLWKADAWEGRGSFVAADGGGRYHGDFKAGQREGHGTMRSAKGNVYEGEWRDGKREGRGTAKFANGNAYEVT